MMANKTTMSLNVRLAAMMGVFGLLIVGIVGTTSWVVGAQKLDGSFINVSGRQRMLSQKFTKEFMLAVAERETLASVTAGAGTLKSLANTRKLFNVSLEALKTGGQTFADVQMTRSLFLPGTDDLVINAQLTKVGALWDELQGMVDKALEEQHLLDKSELNNQLLQINKQSVAVLGNMHQAVGMFQAGTEQRTALLQTIQFTSLGITAGVFAAVLWYILNFVTRPILNIASVIRRVDADRDLTLQAPVKSMDEVGQMAIAFNDLIASVHEVFTSAMVTAEGVNAGSGNVAKRAAANRERAGQELARAKTSSKVIAEMGTTAGQVSEATQAQLDAAQISQERVVELLEKMQQVSGTAEASDDEVKQTLERVGEMGETGAKVVQTAQSQGEMVAKVTTSINEMVSSMEQMQQAVDKATEFGRSSLDAADEGQNSVAATVEGMGAISESSEQISEIIGVITEIAEQTNLLALNAAVEAARAGAHGRGFAVVADEVGKLAQRSSEAAKEITQLIKDSTANVAEGVKLTEQSQQALVRIDEGGRLNMQAIEEISSATGSLSASAQSVQNLVQELNVLAQEIGAMAGEQGVRRAAAQEALDTLAQYSSQIGKLVIETNESVQFINQQMEGVVSRSNEMTKMTALQTQRSQAVGKLSVESAQAAEQTVKGAGAVLGVTEDLQSQSKSLTKQVQQFKV